MSESQAVPAPTPDIPEQFKDVKSFGDFYEMVIINFGVYCKDKETPFINLDKTQMDLLFDAWIDYGLIQRPEIAYNVSIQALRDYHQNLTKESEKIIE